MPIPRYSSATASGELSDRATFLESLLEKRGRAAIDWDAPPAKASFGAAAEREEDASTREPTEEEEAARAAEEAERLERESRARDARGGVGRVENRGGEHGEDSGAFFSHWSPYDRVGVVNADP